MSVILCIILKIKVLIISLDCVFITVSYSYYHHYNWERHACKSDRVYLKLLTSINQRNCAQYKINMRVTVTTRVDIVASLLGTLR